MGVKDDVQMKCLHCGNRIGFVRGLRDRDYCSEEHRRLGRAVFSARLLRDDEAGGYLEAWLPESVDTRRKRSRFNAGAGFAVAALGGMAMIALPDGGSPGGAARVHSAPGFSGGSSASSPLWGDLFQGGRTGPTLREDFSRDLRNWQQRLDTNVGPWEQAGPSVRLGDLRLWKPTLSLTNYNLDFGVQIDHGAVGWAVRASDHNRYYATRVSIGTHTSAGSGWSSEIIRYAVIDGRESSRIHVPIPAPLEAGKTYNIAMRVSGSRFVTLINNQVVDSWNDSRLRRGGVGFFSSPGDRTTLHWVKVGERVGLAERFLSFSFLMAPWTNLPN